MYFSQMTEGFSTLRNSISQWTEPILEMLSHLKIIINKTEVTSVKLVLFKWEKLFDILTLAPAGKLARGVLEIGLLAEIRKK